ncbi:MAG: prepilin-type N-terminal cleavage/methylation domain-containing protein [Planctomycetota bacterium]|jgi:prepilin-type N-terminal cleavage/methylation domain-containing protein
MKKTGKTLRSKFGFSLAEIVAALTIGSILLVVVLGLYNRASNSAAAITEKLNSSNFSTETLQRIAEDLDNIIAAGSNTTVTIENKFDHAYPSGRMIIEKSFYDNDTQLQIFEKIIWQSSYDFESPVPGLVVYRSHSGIALEDKLLDKPKQDWERELFIPICEGVTLFKFQAKQNNKIVDEWITKTLPHAVIATISFAEPFETLDGTLDLFEEDKYKRTIVIDRTRRLGFTYATQYNLDLTEEVNDVNGITESEQDVNDVNGYSI